VAPLQTTLKPGKLTIPLSVGFTNSSSYWADEVLLSIPSSNSSSSSPKYLLAATRSRTTGVPGYVSAFALDSTTGAITSQLFLVPTTNSGGSANAVSPAPFGNEQYFAITDSGSNFVEMWKIDGTSASAVAHLGLDSGPANVVWYS
jgi:carboxy-cis,cis-muconate cyclase